MIINDCQVLYETYQGCRKLLVPLTINDNEPLNICIEAIFWKRTPTTCHGFPSILSGFPPFTRDFEVMMGHDA